MKRILLSAGALALLAAMTGGVANEIETGKATFEAQCADCHFEDDFAGETREQIAALISGIVSGEVEHQGDTGELTEQDIAALAAYFASAQ